MRFVDIEGSPSSKWGLNDSKVRVVNSNPNLIGMPLMYGGNSNNQYDVWMDTHSEKEERNKQNMADIATENVVRKEESNRDSSEISFFSSNSVGQPISKERKKKSNSEITSLNRMVKSSFKEVNNLEAEKEIFKYQLQEQERLQNEIFNYSKFNEVIADIAKQNELQTNSFKNKRFADGGLSENFKRNLELSGHLINTSTEKDKAKNYYFGLQQETVPEEQDIFNVEPSLESINIPTDNKSENVEPAKEQGTEPITSVIDNLLSAEVKLEKLLERGRRQIKSFANPNKLSFNLKKSPSNSEVKSPPSTATAGVIKDKLVDMLQSLGLSKHQVAAGLGFFAGESTPNFDSSIRNYQTGRAFGISQWLGSRLKSLQKRARDMGVDPSNVDLQVAFIKEELLGPERKAFNRIRTAQNLEDASKVWFRAYGRGSDQEYNTSIDKRIKFSRGYLNGI